MAAATPSRPFLCIVPRDDVLDLAEELAGLGGNDIALAQAQSLSLTPENIDAEASLVAEWLTDGFNATIAPIIANPALASACLQHIAARLTTSLELALGCVRIVHSTTTGTTGTTGKALDCLGRTIPFSSGLYNASAVSFSELAVAAALLNDALLPSIHPSQDAIITLSVYNPSDSTLSTLNIILLSSPTAASSPALTQLIEEVIGLHAARRSGEYILKSAHLGVFNQLAAPFIGGNARLFVPTACAPPPVTDALHAVRAVCTRAQMATTDLKWVSSREYIVAVEKRRQAAAAAAAAAARARKEEKEANPISTSTHDETGHHTDRVMESLKHSAEIGAVKRSMVEQSIAAKRKEEEEEGLGSTPMTTSTTPSRRNSSRKVVVDIPVDCSTTTGQQESFSFSPRKEQPHTMMDTRPMGYSSPSDGVCYGSPTPVGLRQQQQQQHHQPPPSSSSSYSQQYRLQKQHRSGAEYSKHTSSSPYRQSRTHDPPPPPPGGQGGYAMMQLSPLPSPSPPPFSAPGAGIFHRHRGVCVGVGGSGSDLQYLPTVKPPPTAVLQRRLWASSTTGVIPPISDVFQSNDGAAFEGDDDDDKQEEEEEEELEFDLREQAVYSMHSNANDNMATAADTTVLEESSESMYTATSTPDHQHEPQHQDGLYNNTSTNELSLEEQVAQERRINSILLRQLQDAEQRAATAAAAATAVFPLENIPHDDFNAALTALQHERHRTAEALQKAEKAMQAKLQVEIQLTAATHEVAVARATCRALEQRTPLAEVFHKSERAVKAAEATAQQLLQENIELTRRVAEAEVALFTKPHALGDGNGNGNSTTIMEYSIVMASLQKKLKQSHGQIRKLQEELKEERRGRLAADAAARTSEVNRRAAEESMRRAMALQAALDGAEKRAEQQSLVAAEAQGVLESVVVQRDEALFALAGEQERCEQLLDLCEALKLRAQVGSTAWLTSMTQTMAPTAVGE